MKRKEKNTRINDKCHTISKALTTQVASYSYTCIIPFRSHSLGFALRQLRFIKCNNISFYNDRYIWATLRNAIPYKQSTHYSQVIICANKITKKILLIHLTWLKEHTVCTAIYLRMMMTNKWQNDFDFFACIHPRVHADFMKCHCI